MAKIFITGSSDGIGLLAAQSLIEQSQEVYLHARHQKRKDELHEKTTGAKGILVGDLSDNEQTKELAKQVNALGRMDAIIHNAGVYTAPGKDIFTVNVLAPYLLTCLIEKPKRLIYVSSDMHLGGHAQLNTLQTDLKSFSYSDSKLLVLMLCKAVARLWPEVLSNALHPGWIPTKMGGPGAPDDLQKGFET